MNFKDLDFREQELRANKTMAHIIKNNFKELQAIVDCIANAKLRFNPKDMYVYCNGTLKGLHLTGIHWNLHIDIFQHKSKGKRAKCHNIFAEIFAKTIDGVHNIIQVNFNFYDKEEIPFIVLKSIIKKLDKKIKLFSKKGTK